MSKNPRRCEKFKGVLVSHDDPDQHLLAHARCKQWTCAYCAKINAKQWRARIYNHVSASDKTWSFVTLTAHRRTHKLSTRKARMDASIANIRQGWDKLRKRIKRRFGRVEYIRVMEQHKSGAVHLHALISVDFGDYKVNKRGVSYSPWLAAQAKDCGMGYVTHAELAYKNPAQVAVYLGKYMTKQSPDFALATKRVRRIQTTQGWAANESSGDLTWEIRSSITDLHILGATKPWYDVTLRRVITIDDADDFGIYPPYDPDLD